jgi:hypothetical protein
LIGRKGFSSFFTFAKPIEMESFILTMNTDDQEAANPQLEQPEL